MARIAMVVFSYYPADPRVRREAEVLERAGHSIEVICLRKAGEKKVESFGSVTALRVMRGSENKESLLKYFILSALFAARALLRLTPPALRGRHDLVQAHNMPDFLVFTGVVHRLMGRPVVLDLHDLTVELFESRTSGRRLIRAAAPLVRAIERVSCSFADLVITTSEGFRRRLIDRGVDPEKVLLVLNSADERVFGAPQARRWNEIRTGPALLYHGTVARRFGLHVAIEAVGIIKKRYPSTTLRIYGKYDPTYRKELEELVASLGLRDAVTINGYLRLDSVGGEIAASDIGVVPYLKDQFMNLALSTKIFEYVSMGMPVVAAGLDSIREIFDEGEIDYFRPGDAADMAARVMDLCRRPERRRLLAERAALAYGSVSWPVMSERYLSAVNGLISGGVRRP